MNPATARREDDVRPAGSDMQIEAMHLALFVENMPATTAFYEVLFGVKPSKSFADYAKFDVQDPPVVFSLQPGRRRAGASLSHMGLRVRTPEQVFAIQNRLVEAGYRISRQDGVTCGYAVQSKCWVFDPDGNPWEIYVLERDVDPSSNGACLKELAPSTDGAAHTAGSLRMRINLSEPDFDQPSDSTVIECSLSGWSGDKTSFLMLLEQIAPAMTPGGQIIWEGIVADHEHSESKTAASASLPSLNDVLEPLQFNGLHRVMIDALVPAPRSCQHARLISWKPAAPKSDSTKRSILYRGPMAQLTDGAGRIWRRGIRTEVTESEWNELQRLGLGELFSLAEDGAAPMCSTGD